MTVWQIIIVVCLYLLVGGVIGNLLARYTDGFDDIRDVTTAMWPIVACIIVVIWLLLVFGNIGEIVVDTVEKIIKSLRAAFNKEK